MKKITTLLLISTFCLSIFSQNDMSSLFNENPRIVFLGLDFTQAKFIGKEGFNDPNKISTYYLAQWNLKLEDEYEKFSLEEELRTDNYTTSTKDLIVLNDGYDVANNLQNNSYSIAEKEVEASVAKYNLSEKEGIGVAYVIESFNKLVDKATIWVTFIDLSTGKMIYTEKLQGETSGFGFRNYWLGAIYNVNKAVKTRYRVWKKTFG